MDDFGDASNEEGEFVRFAETSDGETFVAGVFEAGADVVALGFVKNHEAVVEGGGADEV